MRTRAIKFFAVALLASAFAAQGKAQTSTNKAASKSGYHLIKTIELGGEGGCDYVTSDRPARRLYVSHATHVVVIDADTASTVGDIPNTNGVHGIAIAADLGRGFTSNGRDGSVTVFDLTTLKPLGQVKVGTNPDAIIYDSATHRVFAFNRGSSDVS